MESKEYFEKVMQDYTRTERGVACVSIAKMKLSNMTGNYKRFKAECFE